MTTTTVMERLCALPLISEIPADQRQWLADHGTVRSFVDGDVLYGQGEDVRGVYLVLSGRFSVRVRHDGVEREVRDVRAGDVTGYLPYSRIVKSAGYLVADGPVDTLLIAEADVREMTRACYDFTAQCVHAMVDRARSFKDHDLHREKMAALGRLSAGLAHELNNPSSAMARAADRLDASHQEVVGSARAIGALGLTRDQLAVVDRLEAASIRAPSNQCSPVAMSEREDQFTDWLADHGLEPDTADALAASDLAVSDLDAAATALGDHELRAVVRFIAANLTARQLAGEVVNAATRVHTLVRAVKAHTHMDRAEAPEAVTLEPHLADTLALLGSKAQAKDVTVVLAVDPELPTVNGVVAELNHVWLNLIDNAIDAAPARGRVSVSAKCDRSCVVVAIVDNGPGIAEKDLRRVFDPFFTTKDVGRGVGLGLDVAQTIVRRHGGAIEAISEPGRTSFQVVLPRS